MLTVNVAQVLRYFSKHCNGDFLSVDSAYILSALEGVGLSFRELAKCAEYDDRISQLCDRIDSCKIELSDICDEIHSIADSVVKIPLSA